MIRKYFSFCLQGLFLSLVFIAPPAIAESDSILFLSTQLTPVDEATKMRREILEDFPGEVDFQPNDNRLVYHQIAAGSFSGKTQPGILGGLHGDFMSQVNGAKLDNISDVLASLKDREFVKKFIELGKMGGSEQKYIPWMQATYIMVANRKALKYLPEGANINSLTYEQLIIWGANMKQATGQAKIGFPLSRNALIHRFVQGYLYPSYTGGTVRSFRSAEALAMWDMAQRLWQQVTLRSVNFSHMQEPLLTEEVWVAWDHTARLKAALDKRPDDFVVFPAPAGPKGRGFMVILAGLAIPKDTPNRAMAASLVEYLTSPKVQIMMLNNVGFFPIIATSQNNNVSPGLAAIMNGVNRQASSDDALPALLPTGLGTKGRDFNAVYSAVFSRIVLRGKEAGPVLDKYAVSLRNILKETGVQCWPPDAPSKGACPVE